MMAPELFVRLGRILLERPELIRAHVDVMEELQNFKVIQERLHNACTKLSKCSCGRDE